MNALLPQAAAAGPAARHLADWSLALAAGATVVFAIAMAALLLALRRAGAAEGTDADNGDDAIVAAGRRTARRWILAGGIVLPLVVLVPLFAANVAGTARLAAPAPAGALQIGITARMWWWEVRYADPEGGGAIVTANEIHIPTGRPVLLGLVSADVIHSFWVPALGPKRDAVPGRVAHRLLLPQVARGGHRVVAAEQQGADFVVLGPIYDTPSKRVYGPPLGMRILEQAAQKVRIPIFAIGGITAARTREVRQAGAFGVAVLSSILSAVNVEQATTTETANAGSTQESLIRPR